MCPPSPRHGSARQAQRGASLFIVVVLLLAIGLMTLSAFYLSRGQYRLVGNIQQMEQAFNNTEAVSAAAEQWLQTGTNAKSDGFTTYSTVTPQLYPIGKLVALNLDTKTMAWDDTNSALVGGGRYLIEQLAASRAMPGGSLQVGQRSTGACRAVNLYRITAWSSGPRGAVRLIETLQATNAC